MTDNVTAAASLQSEPCPMPATPTTTPAADAIVRVRGVSKTYAGGFQALKNIDLDIRRGEIFALVGPDRKSVV